MNKKSNENKVSFTITTNPFTNVCKGGTISWCLMFVLTSRSIVGIGTDLSLSFSRGQDAGSFIGAVMKGKNETR